MLFRYSSRNLVLRTFPGKGIVEEYADSQGWQIMGFNEADGKRGQPYQVLWYIEQATVIYLTEDEIARTSYATINSGSLELAKRYAAEARLGLNAWADTELLQEFDNAQEAQRVGRALLRLGIAAPEEFDNEFFSRISEGFSNPDLRVRNVAIWACTYSPWPQYRSRLEQIAETDSAEELRERALLTLEAFDKGGVHEE